MQPSATNVDARPAAVATTRCLSLRIDALVQKRAEGVALARGTTLSRLLLEYVQALSESDQWQSLAWLENARSTFWEHLEQKHR